MVSWWPGNRTSSQRQGEKQQNCIKTPRQLYDKQCPPTRDRVAGDEGMGRNGRCKYGIEKLDSSTSNAKQELDMTSSNTIQETMNATEMTMQKL